MSKVENNRGRHTKKVLLGMLVIATVSIRMVYGYKMINVNNVETTVKAEDDGDNKVFQVVLQGYAKKVGKNVYILIKKI